MHFEERARFRVPPEKLWPLVSDTERLNRAMGLPLMRFRAEPLATGGSRVIGDHPIGSALLAGLGQVLPVGQRVRDPRILRWLPSFPVVRWVEHPFEWEEPRRYAVMRDYFWSPLGLFPFRTLHGGVELTTTPDGGCEVVAFADVVPRNPQGALVTKLILGPRSCQRVIEQCRRFERYVLGESADPFPDLVRAPAPPVAAPGGNGAVVEPSAPGVSPGMVPDAERGTRNPDRPMLATGWAALLRDGVRPELAERLRRHLETAADEAVLKMRPFELADRWAFDRRETLVACLHATTAGLLQMSWDVLCPNCRISKASYDSLADLKGQAHCDFCNVTFDATIDRQVEVRFSVAESIRHVEDRRFCSGGPMNTPHVRAQAELRPGEARLLSARLAPGNYRLRSPQSRGTAVLEVRDEPPSAAGPVAFRVTPEAIVPPLAAAPVPAGGGEVSVRVENGAGVDALVVLEQPDWPDTAATAAVVGTIQEFRDLFGAEVLAPGLQLAIQRLAFLFTDLTGSTAMYEALGQARSFRLVQDHFALLTEPIQRNRGAIVKTIGDAVMAAFPTGADAVAAALAMQVAMRRLDTGGAVDPTRLLKIGIHAGPCIAVTANERLDYFGTTINTAARVEHECRGGQIVFTAAVQADPAVEDLLRERGIAAEPVEAHLRGLREPITLYRVADPIPAAVPVG